MKTNKILLFLAISIIAITSRDNTENIKDNAVSGFNLNRDIALNYYQKGNYEKAIHILEGILSSGKLENDKDELISIHYDLSCNYALLKNKEKALGHLEKAVKYRFANFNHLETNNDLLLLRDDKRFEKIVNTLKKEQALWDNAFINTPYREDISAEEKIAGLSRLWYEIKFNFINFDFVPDINLDSLYIAFISKVRESNSTLEYYRLLQNFCVGFRIMNRGVIIGGSTAGSTGTPLFLALPGRRKWPCCNNQVLLSQWDRIHWLWRYT